MKAVQQRLLSECESSIDHFLSTSSVFKIVRTVSPRSTIDKPFLQPKTLFILDSSFNPPSHAHESLVTTALASDDLNRYPKPHRLLLLFSVHNADKSPVPAAFQHRLAMMIVFAQDLAGKVVGKTSEDVDTRAPGQLKAQTGLEAHNAGVEIDIALTTKPYYNEKSSAIASSHPSAYPSDPQHIHITGFDTITRIFNPKYYPDSDPPLAALAPFFAKHGLRVTARPEDGSAETEIQRQLNWGKDILGGGIFEDVGGKSSWSEKIEIVLPREGSGVSSTKIRQAVGKEDWTEVESLCSKGVADWIREFRLYSD